jgi:predicted dehydrogenase
VRLGLVGAGRWGTRYIWTITQMNGVELAHLASSNPKSADLIPATCRLSSDWREVAGDGTLDGVIIATPPATHLEIAVTAIGNGIPVLVEKPMTLSVDDAQSLIDKTWRAKVPVMVGHTHLFSSAFRRLKERGASLKGLLHTRSVGSNWGPFRPDTPVLWDWGPHDVAMCLELFGDPPRTVEVGRVGALKFGKANGEAIDIRLDFGTKRHADIQVSNISDRKQRYFEASYSDGVLAYDDLADSKLLFRASPASPAEVIPVDGSLPLTNVVTAFCERIRSGELSTDGLELGLRVVEVLADCQAKLDTANTALGR